MEKKHRTFLIVLTLAAIVLSLSNVYAQPIVELVADPDIQTLRIGGRIEEIFLTARIEEQHVKLRWMLEGPGKIEGDITSPGILYIVPDSIDSESTKVIITVVVIDIRGNELKKSVSFTLVSPTAPIIPEITPTPEPAPLTVPTDIHPLLKEKDGTIIKPTYFVEPGGSISVDIGFAIPLEPHIQIECTAIFGKVQQCNKQEILYRAMEANYIKLKK